MQFDLASNGEEAIAAVEKKTYDIILMDVQMPIMDGLTATRAIRKSHTSDQLPIIALTANVQQEDKENCLKAGMNDFLTKPLEFERLESTLINHLKSNR